MKSARVAAYWYATAIVLVASSLMRGISTPRMFPWWFIGAELGGGIAFGVLAWWLGRGARLARPLLLAAGSVVGLGAVALLLTGNGYEFAAVPAVLGVIVTATAGELRTQRVSVPAVGDWTAPVPAAQSAGTQPFGPRPTAGPGGPGGHGGGPGVPGWPQRQPAPPHQYQQPQQPQYPQQPQLPQHPRPSQPQPPYGSPPPQHDTRPQWQQGPPAQRPPVPQQPRPPQPQPQQPWPYGTQPPPYAQPPRPDPSRQAPPQHPTHPPQHPTHPPQHPTHPPQYPTSPPAGGPPRPRGPGPSVPALPEEFQPPAEPAAYPGQDSGAGMRPRARHRVAPEGDAEPRVVADPEVQWAPRRRRHARPDQPEGEADPSDQEAEEN